MTRSWRPAAKSLILSGVSLNGVGLVHHGLFQEPRSMVSLVQVLRESWKAEHEVSHCLHLTWRGCHNSRSQNA